jgi:hypothetical protein
MMVVAELSIFSISFVLGRKVGVDSTVTMGTIMKGSLGLQAVTVSRRSIGHVTLK